MTSRQLVGQYAVGLLALLAKPGRKFAIGQVFLVFIFAPTGNGLSFFRTATRSGFERCNKNSNPIINPITYIYLF